MANGKAGQDDFLMMADSSGGRKIAWTNAQLQLTQFIAVHNTQTPARLPSGVDGPLKQAKVVLKREGEVDVRRLAWSPFVSREAHSRGEPAEGDRLVVGMEVTKEPLNF